MQQRSVKPRVARKLAAPQNKDELAAVLRQIGKNLESLRRIRERTQRRMSALEESSEALASTIRERVKEEANRVYAYLRTHTDELLGSRRSVSLSSGILALRTSADAVLLTQSEEEVLAYLDKHRPEFVRVKKEINKRAMLDSPDRAKGIPGVEIGKRELFTIKPHHASGAVKMDIATETWVIDLPPEKK